MHYFWIVLSLLLVFAANGEPGSILESEFVTTHEASTIRSVVEHFYPPEQVLAPQYAVDEYKVVLASTNEDGEPIEIHAQLYVPAADEAASLPVYVLGAGSSGLVDACAPSREQPDVQNWGSYRAFMLSIAAQGYIAILPDYAYFHEPELVQPYYVASMAGRVLLDAGRAVYALFDEEASALQPDTLVTPADQVFLAGYSQGGQSIFAAKDLWETYAPDLPLAGVIGYAPVNNMQSHMVTLPQLSTYRMYAWAQYYGEDQVDVSQIFSDHWLPTLEEDVLRLCVIDAAGYFSANPAEMYRPEFLAALTNDTLAEDYPVLHELFERNNPGFVQNDVPALIIQGTLDRTIPMPVHEAFTGRYCEAGNRLTENIYDEATHFIVRQVSYRDVFDWMETIVSGETPREDCPTE
jgi:hypothetical protein